MTRNKAKSCDIYISSYITCVHKK